MQKNLPFYDNVMKVYEDVSSVKRAIADDIRSNQADLEKL